MSDFDPVTPAENYLEQTPDLSESNRGQNIKDLISRHRELITGNGRNRWLEHLENDLMRFWLAPEVTDMSRGLFRSFFTNLGEQLPGFKEFDRWPDDLQRAAEKDENGNYILEAGAVLEGADFNFVRTHSQQVFAYGIAYHITGRADCFNQCKKGADALMDLLKPDGSIATRQRFATGEFLSDINERTSRDLVYAMAGIGIYYYLTHDAVVLRKIRALKDYIFKYYFHKGKGMFTLLPYEAEAEQKAEFALQLDHLRVYLLWLSPCLPKKEKDEFKGEIKRITDIMIEHFYTETCGGFWGPNLSGDMIPLATRYTDFGYCVQAMRLIYQAGIWTENAYYINFAREKMHGILESAFDDKSGWWNRRINYDGTADKDKVWWAVAELNLAAAMLAVKDPSYLRYLNGAYGFWFENMTDHENGEIWHMLDGETFLPKKDFPKMHGWKNGLYSLEHNLIGYLTSKQILGESTDLYYAFASVDEVKYQTVTPYIFKGNITGKKEVNWTDNFRVQLNAGEVSRKNIKVTFDSLH